MSAHPRLAPPDIVRTDLADGSVVLRNRTPLPDPLPDVLARFDAWRTADPAAPFLTARTPDGRRTIGYGEAADLAARLAAWLDATGVRRGDAVAVIGAAGIAHALLKLACLMTGAVHVPLAPAMLASPHGHRRLAGQLAIARPVLTVLPDEHGRSLPEDLRTAAGSVAGADQVAEALVTAPTSPFRGPEASARDRAAIYFTSGSTGTPKGVPITRAMIASNQSAYAAHWPFLARTRPALIDWLPWHHVFGGLDNFYKMIWNGGAYHIEAAPDPARVDEMAQRIREVRPTMHIGVPFGIALLLDRFDGDDETRAALFERLEVIFFAGAGMDARTWTRLQDAVAAGPHGPGGPPTVLSGYGATEAASTICLGHEPAGRTSEIGLPLPGHELRLAPVDDAYEVRVRGPNVAAGYLGPDGMTPLPFDEEGFFRTGDLVAAAHGETPEHGLRFDGRLAEDFKLTTGTRVKVGALRHALLEACTPHLDDVAIAGEGHERIAVILFPAFAARNRLGEDDLAAALRAGLAGHNIRHPGSSTTVWRAVVSADPPDREAGEINDKGHLVQRRTLKNRADLVARLYARDAGDGILELPAEART